MSNAKLVLTPSLVAAILPHATTLVDGSGKLWNAARDAYNIALVDFPDAEDAAKAVKQVIKDELKANDGSVRSYFSTLVWLVKAGHDTAQLTMGQATDLRYPKAEPIAPDDFAGQLAKLERDTAKKREKVEKAAQEYAKTQSPRGKLLQQVASLLADCDDAELALIAAEIISIKAQLRDTSEAQEETREAEAA